LLHSQYALIKKVSFRYQIYKVTDCYSKIEGKGVIPLLADRLTQLRKENKKTQQQVADYLKITRPAYTAYERGTRQPDYDTLKKIADFFVVSVDYLLGRTDNPNGTPEHDDKKAKEEYDPLAEINKLVEKYGIEQMGFFDIEKWKKLGPEDIKMLEKQFKLIVDMAEEREKKD
jgi:HTH-type transcriptional regulator, competence development regulator